MKNIISVILFSCGLVISNSSLDAACRGGRCGWRRPAPRVSTPAVRRSVTKRVVAAAVAKKIVSDVNKSVNTVENENLGLNS